MKLIRTVTISACMLLFIAVLLCIISDMTGPSPSIVYAEQETDQMDVQSVPGIHAGLEGMFSGIECVRSYDYDLQAKYTYGPGEEILVGAKDVSRSLIDRSALVKGIMKAGEVGYSALQEIAENQMSYEDYSTLLRIVEAEATGGDVKSKMLVANVVLNRTKDSHFPDTISEVVWQRVGGSAQFSPTADGRFYSVTITKSTIEAVERVLAGEDYSQGALFFVARSSANSKNLKWFDASLVKLFEYGGHEFSTFKEYREDGETVTENSTEEG